MPLNERQQKFAQEYIIDMNATKAAQRAGYSEKTCGQIGHELLKKPEIQVQLQKEINKRSERTEITQDYVLTRLRENVERAMQNVPVLDREGNPTGEYRYEGSVANKALELLGRHLRIWGDEGKNQEAGSSQFVLNVIETLAVNVESTNGRNGHYTPIPETNRLPPVADEV